MPYKPMLAYTIEDTSKLTYPLYVSEKLDGLRCIIENGVAYSRSGKPFRSPVVQEMFASGKFDGLDGELVYGDKNAKDVFSKSTTACMSKEWPKELDKRELHFYVFDYVDESAPYHEREQKAFEIVMTAGNKQVEMLQQHTISNEATLLALEAACLEAGGEGVMCRSIDGRYKHGRSTAKDGIIGKLKRFSQSEAHVIGFEEKLTNTNEKKRDEFGYAERSTSKEGMVPAGTLGAFLCKDLYSGVEFSMGSGLNDALRDEIWNNQEEWLGKIVTYKFFAVGVKESTTAPRFPIFLSERSEYDLS